MTATSARSEPLWAVHAWLVAVAASLLVAAHAAWRLRVLYLVPAGASALAAVAVAAGVVFGLAVARALSPHRGDVVPWPLLATALAVLASSFVPFVAFDAGTWASTAAAVCLLVTSGALTTAGLVTARAVGHDAATLGLVRFVLRPSRVPGALLGVLLVEMLLARAGFLRSGAVVAALVTACAASYPAVHRLLHATTPRDGRAASVASAVVGTASVVALFAAQRLVPARELLRFPDEIVFATSSDVADYAVVASPGGYELFVDGQLAVSSLDEPRRTAALVAPVLSVAPRAARVLLLHGGLGPVERALLADARVETVTTVSPDATRGALARRIAFLAARTGGALDAARLQPVVAEPLVWLAAHPEERFDVVIADFPWPLGYREGKLYTHHAFVKLAEHLADDGVLVVPAGSAFTARDAFASVVATLASTGLTTAPYHVAVPTVGVASFVVASRRGVDPARLAIPFPGIDVGTDLGRGGRAVVATLHAQTVVTAFDDARARR
ncbi:MAG TPA: hypothetical protein VH062_20720 [Polyangiaceae bacterium]|nr:hypothetical protein [Polyangiaceae bacterium]